MVSHLFYYQLALLALSWLFIMLQLSWPGRSAPPPNPLAPPIKPKPKRSPEPKACEGLTHKPHCALCEQEVVYLPPADNSPRLTRRLSKGLKGPYGWALMASQQPSEP